jgi:outer membrane immunogenic protein
MRRFIFAGLALVALNLPAAAADMPAYDKAPIAAFNWTGFYLGGDIGVASTTSNAQWNPASTSAIPFGVSPTGGGTGGASFIGGVLAGYDWQFASAWVAGVEADWTGMKAGVTQPPTVLENAAFAAYCGRNTSTTADSTPQLQVISRPPDRLAVRLHE